MGRSRKTVWRWRIVAALLLAGLAAAGWGWWQARGWQPDRAAYPVQGVLIGEGDGVVDMMALRGAGAGFVYLEASSGASGRDARLADNIAAAAAIGLPHGVVHAFDPCIPAQRQAANLVTIVPRDAALLPPVIALDPLARACGDPIVEAGLEAELTTFVNQVEGHTGQPVVLKVSSAFEDAHAIAMRIERNLWLERDFMEPDYAGRPWTLWTATRHLRIDAADGPVRWVVVQP